MVSETDVTGLVLDVRSGDADAVDRLFPIVYDELRIVARRMLYSEREGHTLSTTALVHEVYVKMVDQSRVVWEDQAHFCGIAARAMRQILIDYARRRNALKRGGGKQPISLDEGLVAIEQQASMLISLDEALSRLEKFDERSARVVEARFFGGLTDEETAEALRVSSRTVRRDWVRARAWLHAELYPESP